MTNVSAIIGKMTINVSAIIQIAILYLVFYAILKSAKGSRFGQALMGFGILAAILIEIGRAHV